MKKTLFMTLAILSLLLVACTTPSTSSSGISQKAPAKLASSIEQDNINNRLKIVNDPSTTMWFYGLSDTGSIIFKSVVKGKVTSSGKRLEPIHSGGSTCGSYALQTDYNGNNICSDEILQADGTFGSSDNYVYWYDFEGNYYQWSGLYVLTTKPLKINVPVIEFQGAQP